MLNKKILCLAVDDEPPALTILQEYVRMVPGLDLVQTCNNAVEAIDVIQHKKIDLMFLDIQMPQLLGTNFIRTLKNPPKVIFTTAYRKFAVEGFELNAVDYLLKPISFERFLKAVNKVMDITLEAQPNYMAPPEKQSFNDYLCFRSNRKIVKVALQEILYIESLKDYIKVVTSVKTIISKQSISSLEETLSKEKFIRIHRSYIVALDKIESYSSEIVEVSKKEFPISRMYRHEVQKILNIA